MIKIKNIYPDYEEMEGNTSKSFNAEIHMEAGVYYLECYATCEYQKGNLYQGRGLDPDVMTDKDIEVTSGHFISNEEETTELNDFKKLNEILTKNISLV